MSNRWSEDLRRRMERYEVDAPDGLFDDIMGSLPELSEPLQPKAEPSAEPAPEATPVVPLWRRYGVAAAVAAVLIMGVMLYLQPFGVEQPSQSVTTLALNQSPIESAPQIPLVSETIAPESEPATLPYTPKAEKKTLPEVVAAEQSPTQSLQSLPTQSPQPAQEQAQQPQEQPKQPSQPTDTQTTTRNQSQRPIYSSQPPRRAVTRRGVRSSTDGRLQANLFTSGFSGGSRGSFSQQLFSLNSVLYGSRVQADGTNTNQMLLPDASRTISHDVHHHQPIRAGVSFRYALSSKWSLESGVQYAKLMTDLSSGNKSNYFDERLSLHYIGLPVNAIYNIWHSRGLTLYATAGGMVEKCVSGSLRTDYIIDGEHSRRSRSEAMVDELQWSVTAGVGMQFNLSPTVGLYAEPGVGYWFDNGNDLQTIYHDRPLNFNLNLGLRFTIK